MYIRGIVIRKLPPSFSKHGQFLNFYNQKTSAEFSYLISPVEFFFSFLPPANEFFIVTPISTRFRLRVTSTDVIHTRVITCILFLSLSLLFFSILCLSLFLSSFVPYFSFFFFNSQRNITFCARRDSGYSATGTRLPVCLSLYIIGTFN